LPGNVQACFIDILNESRESTGESNKMDLEPTIEHEITEEDDANDEYEVAEQEDTEDVLEPENNVE